MAHDLDKYSHAGIRKQLGLPDRTGAQELPPGEHRAAPGGIAASSRKMHVRPAAGVAPSDRHPDHKAAPILSNSPALARGHGMLDHPVYSSPIGKRAK